MENINIIIFSLLLTPLVFSLFFSKASKIIKKIKPKDNVIDLETAKKQYKENMQKEIEERDKKIRKDLKFNKKSISKKSKGFFILGKEHIKKEKPKEKILQNKDEVSLFNMFD